MSQDPVVIVSAARTPMGGMQGELKDFAAPELGAAAIRAAVEHIRAELGPRLAALRAAGRPREAIGCYRRALDLKPDDVAATGDEVVELDRTPLPYQIRNSNSYSLRAQVAAAGTQENWGARVIGGLVEPAVRLWPEGDVCLLLLDLCVCRTARRRVASGRIAGSAAIHR